MNPKISIILPSYNYAQLLVTALASISAQTEKSWELVAVDDGSTDDSLEILQRFAEARAPQVRVFTHPGGENRGLAQSVALARGHCRGEFVAFLDADDFLYPESLDRKRTRLNSSH